MIISNGVNMKTKLQQKRKIVLASRSKARKAILKDVGLKLEVAFPDVDEKRLPKEPIKKFLLRIATNKAKRVAKGHKSAVIIAVDTIIVNGRKIYGKPGNEETAREFLKELSGKWHKVLSGTVVFDSKTKKFYKKLIKTDVKFKKLTKRVIDWYVKTGEPINAAGAYAIQGKGMSLIAELRGCFTNVIGISIPWTLSILKKLNVI
jgi:septum formation protein